MVASRETLRSSPRIYGFLYTMSHLPWSYMYLNV